MYRPFVRRRTELRDVSWPMLLSFCCWCLLSSQCSQAFVPAVSRSIRNSLHFSPHRLKRPWALQKDPPVQPSSLGYLYMAAPNTDVKTEPDWTSNDPYRILCLSRSATLSDKDIKRAYRRLAMQYHPDVATTRDSTAEEKRVAADRFAKINAAYNRLLENKDVPSRESTASTTGWQPPHRRSGSTATSSGRTQSKTDSFSTDWRDFMPKTNADEVYDAGGDSFGKIFSDLLQGASAVAGAAGSGGGVFRDFVEFLEQNVDGYGRNIGDNDSELAFLLQTGSMQEIADEMDETELVVQQLSSKLDKVQNEFLQVQAELAVTDRRYSETLELRERSDELQAQKGVVENYLKRARVRLSKLQVKYKELIVSGGGSRASRRQNTGYSESTARSSASTFKEPATESPGTRKKDSTTSPDEAWKEEGFGSFGGRSRGSSRRRSQQVQSPPSSSNGRATASYDSTQRSSTPEPYANRREVRSPSKNMQESSVSSIDDVSTNVPPHRRNSSQKSFERTIEEEKRRLRDIKVDEAFDQLKRDLGL